MAHDPSLERQFRDLMSRYNRIAIAGGPRCGKTTLATFARDQIGDRSVFTHDDFKGFEWSAVPEAMMGATQSRERFVIEGVNVARALRKGLEVDAVVYLHKARVPRVKGQISMAKGVHTVFMQWRESNQHVPVFAME